MPESPHHDRPLQGIFMVSTASTAHGYTFDNGLPVSITYAGYKTITGEFAYAETDIDRYPIIAVEEKGDLIASGRWDSAYTAWSKIGYNPDSGAGTEEVVAFQGGSPVWAASSGQGMQVVSNNNNDKAAGTGLIQVWVKYLGSDYLEYSTVVTMNGTTAIMLVDTSISRILNFQAYSGVPPLGVVSIGATTGGVISQMGIGQTRARNSMWTVPSGKTLFIKNVYYSAAVVGTGKGVPARFLLKTNYNTNQDRYSTSLFWPVSANLLEDSPLFATLYVPLRIPEKTDLFVSATLTAASSANVAETILRGWTVDN